MAVNSDFNPNTPTMIGSEDFLITSRRVDLGANTIQGYAQRINPGAITPKALSSFNGLSGIVNSLHNIELVDTLTPTILSETIFPGTDTGSFDEATWQDETGAAAAFGKVNKNNDDSTFLSLKAINAGVAAAAPGIGWSTLNQNNANLGFRGNRAGTYRADSPASRPVMVQINVRMAFAATTTSAVFRVNFAVGGFGDSSSTGARNVVSSAFQPKSDGIFRTYSLVIPADPWAMASVNTTNPFWNAPHYAHTWDNIVTTSGPYQFGIVLTNVTGAATALGDVKVSGMWLNVNYCAENRRMSSYPRAVDLGGWTKTPAYGPDQRQIIFTSNSGTTALTTPAGGTNGAGDFTAGDVGKTIVRQSDGQVVGTIQSVTNSTTAVLQANGASTNAGVVGVLGTAVSALSGATFYYLVHGSTWAGSAKSSSPFNILQDPTKIVLTAPGSNGENRTCYNLAFTNAGSMVAATSTATTGELIPCIISTNGYATSEAAASDVSAESVGYDNVDYTGTNANNSKADTAFEIRSGQSVGQQVTTAAATTYQAVKLAVCRFSSALDPDQPLTIEIRHGAGSLTGGGTLDATATVYPSQLSSAYGVHKPSIVEVVFATAFTSILNTQYVVYCKSSATAGRGWALVVVESLDSAPYNLTGNIATIGIEGPGIGGTTDGFVRSTGSVVTNTDAMVALCAQPTTPGGFSGTAVAAA